MIKSLNKNIEKLIEILKKSNLEDMSMLLGSKKRMLSSNFWAGIFRGFGFSLGFTLITAITIIILRKVLLLNIPVIGDYINDIIDILKLGRS